MQPRLARLPGNPRAAQSASSLLSIAPFDSRPHKSATTPPPERSANRQQSMNTEKLRATRTFEHFEGRVLWKPDPGAHPSAAALIAARRLFVHSQHVSRGKAAGQSPLYARNAGPGPMDVAALSRVASAPAIRPTTLLQSVLFPGAARCGGGGGTTHGADAFAPGNNTDCKRVVGRMAGADATRLSAATCIVPGPACTA